MDNVRNAYGSVITLKDAEELGVLDAAEALLKPVNKPFEALFAVDLPLKENIMADDSKVTEEQRAQLSKRRGQAAAQIVDPDERRKFISAQGDAEAANKGNLKVSTEKQLSQESALKGYKHGTTRVAETGPAMLHKNEAVLPVKAADKYRGSMSLVEAALAHKSEDSGMGEKPKKSKKELKEIRTRKAKSGGYIHEHHHTSPVEHPMEEHTSPNAEAMLEHMQEHMGGDEAETHDSPAEEAAEGGVQ